MIVVWFSFASTWQVIGWEDSVFVECDSGAPARFKIVDAQPVGSGASSREMTRNIDNYFT